MTRIPTLTFNDAQARLAEIFIGEGDCELPCWKGIIPGQTSVDQVETLFVPLESIAHFHEDYAMTFDDRDLIQSGLRTNYPIDDATDISVFVTWYEYENVPKVEMIQVLTANHRKINDDTWEDVFGDPTYNQIFERYSLSEILLEFGQPSEVLVFATISPMKHLQDLDRLSFIVRYPEQGISLTYTLPFDNRNGQIGTGCLADATVDWWLSPLGNNPFYRNFQAEMTGYSSTYLGQSVDPYRYFQSVEDATGLTIKEFTNLFNENEKGCIDVRLDIWPKP